MSEEQAPQEEMEIELPPILVQFLNELKSDQKKLLKERQYGASADQLRKYVGLTLMPRVIQMVEMLGVTALDTHQMGVSNANQLMRMRRWTAEHLRKLGVEVNDGEPFPGIGTKELDDFGQNFYALGTRLNALGLLLAQKLPNDPEAEAAFNACVTAQQRCAASYRVLVEAVMGDQSVPGEDEPEEEEEETSEGDEAAEPEPETTGPEDGAS